MKFGVKASEAPKGGSKTGGKFLNYFTKGDKTLRFLEEMSEWTVFYDHFNRAKSRSFPCTGDKLSCPGCTAENERDASASKRYLVNAVEPSTGYVNLWKIPVSIIDDLTRFAEKDGGTICARDFVIVNFKDSAGKTKYSVDYEPKEPMDLASFTDKMQDHQQGLMAAYVEVWGGEPGAETEEPERNDEQTVRGRLQTQLANAQAEAAESVDVSEHGKFDQEPPTEPAGGVHPDQASDQGDDEIELTEDQVRAMSAAELKALFKECGLPVPRVNDPTVLAERLLSELAA